MKMSQFNKVQMGILSTVNSFESRKIEKKDFDSFLVENGNKLYEFEDVIAKHENHIKSIENYIEKYVPCNT